MDYAKVDLTWLRVGDNNTWREVIVYVVLEDRTVCSLFIMTKLTPRVIEATEVAFVGCLIVQNMPDVAEPVRESIVHLIMVIIYIPECSSNIAFA